MGNTVQFVKSAVAPVNWVWVIALIVRNTVVCVLRNFTELLLKHN